MSTPGLHLVPRDLDLARHAQSMDDVRRRSHPAMLDQRRSIHAVPTQERLCLAATYGILLMDAPLRNPPRQLLAPTHTSMQPVCLPHEARGHRISQLSQR